MNMLVLSLINKKPQLSTLNIIKNNSFINDYVLNPLMWQK